MAAHARTSPVSEFQREMNGRFWLKSKSHALLRHAAGGQDVSFTIRKEKCSASSPNGAGKTTTMQIISGNLAPSGGSVTIAGHDLLDDPRAAKSQIGYLPEQPPLYRELTVDEYLDYCAALNRLPRAQRRRAREAAKERCGLQDTGRRLIGNLSKGFQQRVGIAQAIIHLPPW
jgi:ABC-2 type transport system ATP-binding protein